MARTAPACTTAFINLAAILRHSELPNVSNFLFSVILFFFFTLPAILSSILSLKMSKHFKHYSLGAIVQIIKEKKEEKKEGKKGLILTLQIEESHSLKLW